jgi:hypothetical protein
LPLLATIEAITSDLGHWKNHPTHENGEHSMLIDINGDGLLDRVFDRKQYKDKIDYIECG